MASPYRADHVGSLLRPSDLLEARTDPNVTRQRLTAMEDRYILGVLKRQKDAGFRIFTDYAIPGWATITLLSLLVLSFIALGNFIVLFAVFSHSRGLSLANVEHWDEESARKLTSD